MKKYQNLILIMSLLFIIHLNAQEYVLKINYFKFDVEREYILCGDNNKMELKVILKNGEEHLIRENGGYNFSEKNIEKKYSSPIGSIYFYSFTHQEAWADFFSCNGYSTGIKHSEPIRNICKNDIIRRESSKGTIKNTVVINYETYPIIKFDSFQENTIGYDTQCSIKLEKSSTHFPEDTYRYEYAIMENIPSERDWTEKNLPNTFKSTAFPSIKLSDFLPKTVIGNYIWFRAKSACGGTYRSNPIRFKILASTPDVISQGTISTKCPGGSIDYPLQFNRGLKSGEKLEVTIKYPDGRTKSIPNKDEKEFKLDANNVYIFKGLRKGIHSITISGEGDVYSSYAFRDHPFVLNVQDPDQLNFIDWARIDPSCYKGNDGYIIIGASGGTGNKQIKVNNDSWVPFNEDDHHSLKNLTAGEYKIRVKDVNECNGKLYSEDSEVLTITLSNPPQPQAVLDTRKTQQPTYHSAKNGKIVVELAGGTPLNRIILWKYKTIWKNAQNQIIKNAYSTLENGRDYAVLENISAGTYHLLVTDKHNCTITNTTISLGQPDPLTAEIQLVQPISCNSTNQFGNETDSNVDNIRDEAQDGILYVKATGGVPFKIGLPYKYTWKKKDHNDVWRVYTDVNTSTIKKLSEGEYAVNIEDANGIVIGRYENNMLKEKQDVTYYLHEPEQLTLTIDRQNATCKGNDGKITAHPAGGTPPYFYDWSNGVKGSDVQTIENLQALPYFVKITDNKGCQVQGSINIEQPNKASITETITPLICHNGNNASIEATITGGTPPYTYLWNTGATTAHISGLTHGTYELTVTDAQGCNYQKSFNITNPEAFTINLGGNRTLCKEQTLSLNIKIDDNAAQYRWYHHNTLISNTPELLITEGGSYRVEVTTSKGCTATDEITVTMADMDIASEFFLSTQAYVGEEVVLVNVSKPKGETTQWLVPEGVEIKAQNDDYITVVFPKVGEYNLGIRQTQKDCFANFYKKIIVEEGDGQSREHNPNQSFVREFVITPNPNDGNFTVRVKLEKESTVKLRLYNMAGQLIKQQSSQKSKEHTINFQEKLAGGTYIIVVETTYQRMSKKLIIN
nr:T9SS type A sorting domain-containing protein [uncultured Capnocytophaga sp.]